MTIINDPNSPETWRPIQLGTLRRGAVTSLRSAAEAWANVEVPDGTWSASEIADWLSIKADLIEEGGDL